jgi:flagellar biosynthesis anti-sigma factor FlgM
MTQPIQMPGRMPLSGQVDWPSSDKSGLRPKDGATPLARPDSDQWIASGVAQQAQQAGSGFDHAKVEAIKQAVQSGQYPLDPRRMAESFLAMERLIND